MAQLTGRLAEDKYRGSMEKIGKIIAQYSHYPGIDLITFYELTLFAFITGNADMHLKNFSLLTNLDNEVMLSPAYDLISTALLIPNDNEELALPINGRQNHLRLSDFNLFADKLGIHPVSALNVHKKFFAGEQSLINFIEKSFLTEKMKTKYQELIRDRLRRIKSQHMIN
jgi:serine/threonine-protein kinase HipA